MEQCGEEKAWVEGRWGVRRGRAKRRRGREWGLSAK